MESVNRWHYGVVGKTNAEWSRIREQEAPKALQQTSVFQLLYFEAFTETFVSDFRDLVSYEKLHFISSFLGKI